MRNLVIVESPSKATTINSYLGKDYKVLASVGHVRDLPKSTLGVDIEHDFKLKYINIKGIPLKIVDTAGIRNTTNEIEQIGVKKSIDNINNAELIIAVFDDSRAFDKEDEKILDLIKNKKAIILINKVDLNKNLIKEKEEIKKSKNKIIEFSTIEEKGLDELYKTIEEMFKWKEIQNDNSEIITNNRQKQQIILAKKSLENAKNSVFSNMPIDITAICLKEILENLTLITGENISEEIINKIFEKFCLGK